MRKVTLLMSAVGVLVFTGCATKRVETVSTTPASFEELPDQVQDAARYEIGNSKVLGARPSTLAGNSGYYDIDYVADGRHKVLKIDEWGTSISKSDWGTIIEAAGAERKH